MKQANYINHIGIVLDASGSMYHIDRQAAEVVDTQIKNLADRSRELDQETRVTVYTFNTSVECVHYDKDVLRTPSIKQDYRVSGQTALIDATIQAINEMRKTATLYGDHSFLLYVITDGAENASGAMPSVLSDMIQSLPDNWTVAALVPDQSGVWEAKKFGFLPGNIQVWDTSAKGMVEVGETIRRTTDAYMQGRSSGIRSYSSLFSMDTSNLTPSNVQSNVPVLSASDYVILKVNEKVPIKDFVVRHTGRAYRAGQAYYELTKTEEIQPYKEIALRSKRDGEFFVGGEARRLLNLPNMYVKVGPGYSSDYDVFVQSTSTNRNLIPGTDLLVLR